MRGSEPRNHFSFRGRITNPAILDEPLNCSYMYLYCIIYDQRINRFNMNPLPLSFIAEYQYCPRSAFYLLTDAPRSRDENDYIQSGRAVHQKVDEGYVHSKETKKIKSSVKIYSEKYSITGKADILEFHENGEIIPVELKRGKQR